jgi:uncharacterized protein (TIRG00374 family)
MHAAEACPQRDNLEHRKRQHGGARLGVRLKQLVRHAARLLPALLSVGLAVYVLRGADLGRALSLVRSLRFWLPLLLLPNLVLSAVETLAWRLALTRVGARPRFFSLLSVRLAVEATMLALPSGAVISESLQPYLLKRRCRIPFETAVVAGVGRKFLVVVSHALVLVVTTLMAWPLLTRVSRATIGRGGLPWLLLGAGLSMAGLFVFGVMASVRGQVAERLRLGLDRLFGRWLGSWLESHSLHFQRADSQMVDFFARAPAGLVLPMILSMLGWIVHGVESMLFLRVLGVKITLTAATVLEAALILVRSLAVPVPAGLGVQDLAYVLSLRALDIPDATTVGAAFVLLKRAKDLFYVLVGFVLLGAERRGRAATPASDAGKLGSS